MGTPQQTKGGSVREPCFVLSWRLQSCQRLKVLLHFGQEMRELVDVLPLEVRAVCIWARARKVLDRPLGLVLTVDDEAADAMG